ncbi:MAG: hypothetical protein HAW63_02140 [Bdellovibrionaceae bacterium]|nr:hypothetical protein [Pseudobdellovibrionaceae bacterium]
MKLISADGFLDLELIQEQESFSLKESDLAYTSLVKDLKSHCTFQDFIIELSITPMGKNNFLLEAFNTGNLNTVCGKCARNFNQEISFSFKEILLFTEKVRVSKNKNATQSYSLNKTKASDKQHHNLGTESDTFVQEITNYKFSIIQWLYENITMAISEQNFVCKKKDCKSVFQNLLKTTNTNYKATTESSKPNTHKILADLLKPLKKH